MAPAFSIIVPVYNVAEELPACLESILAQSGAEFEVIAVDDASTDDSATILDDFARRDPRIAVIRQSSNGGLGRARNSGMARARAPYIVFVDSDDMLAGDALARVAERIAATGRPDVVMVGFARIQVDGRVVPDRRSRCLAPPMCGSLKDRPELLEVLPTAWNKVYSRDFLAEHRFEFPVGVYEDVPWTYPVLISAGRIATLDHVCYLYRQHDRPHLLNVSGARHYDVFAQYDRLFGFVDAHPELESWRRPLFDRLLGHVPTILDLTERIPPAERRAFYAAMSDTVRRHRPPGYLPTGAAGVKVLLMTHGNYATFRMAQIVKRETRDARARLRSSRLRTPYPARNAVPAAPVAAAPVAAAPVAAAPVAVASEEPAMRRRLELVVRRVYRLVPGFARPAARLAWPVLVTCLEGWRVLRTRRFRVSAADARALSRPLISVVMPVYNVAEYLPAAAHSVLAQRHVNLELILVDDGASDGSADVCDRIARDDPRVRVVHQANAGLGAARNTGVAASRGTYLAFADSDDWVLPNAYAAMLAALLRTDSDFVSGNVVRRHGWTLRQAWNQQRSHRTDRFGTTLMSHPDLLYDSVAWNKLFRADFWRDRVGDFPVGKLYEDMLPITRAFLAARAVDVLARPVYVWRMRDDGTSITQRLLEPQNIADRMEMADAIAAVLSEHESGGTLSPRLVHKILETDLWIHVREVTADSDPASLDQLAQMVRRHWSTASPENSAAIPVDRRICYWLIENERGQDIPAFRAWWETVHAAPSTRRVGDCVLLDLRDCPVPLDDIPDRYLSVP